MDKKVLFISLGCDKNLVDSEVMLGLLKQRGYCFTNEYEEAEAIVVNTCCFIGDAKEESINTLLEVAELKKTAALQCLIVTGCLGERYREEITKEIPEVDAILGTASIQCIADAMDKVFEGKAENVFMPLDSPLFESSLRVNSTGQHYASLKIAEGCDKRCTYCIIPYLRGPYRSYPMEYLVKEAERLAESGITELLLVAQETTVYGCDLYGHKALPELLRRLNDIEGLHWIRILYCYPEEIDDDLIEAIATLPKVCHYLDLPIQHASDDVLRRMGRRTDEEDLIRIILKLKERIPDIALRTTLISGFPGESEEDFQELYRFVNEMEFDRLGCFTYSREEDTPAAGFPDQIPEETKKARRDELMELQQAVAFDLAEEYVGKTFEVVIEGSIPEEDIYVGRTYRDAPDIDGYVFMPIDRDRMSGDYVNVTITGTQDYDLIGEITDEPAQ